MLFYGFFRYFLKSLIGGAFLAAMLGCNAGNDTQAVSPDEQISKQTSESSADRCPALDSRNWQASVRQQPREKGSKDYYQLAVTGEIDLPTPGYDVQWRAGIMDRALPPGLRLHLLISKPEGVTAQVMTATAVNIETPAVYARYREILIICEGEVLTRIAM